MSLDVTKHVFGVFEKATLKSVSLATETRKKIENLFEASLYIYSKTCLNWPLKNRQNKDLRDKW